MTQASTLWTEADLIHVYTTEQAVEDGQLIDAQIGDLAEVTRQHVGGCPVFLTLHLYSTIKKAVENKRHCNDWKGVWHDVLWMSFVRVRPLTEGARKFRVTITGVGRRRIFQLLVVADGSGLTFMHPQDY